ncbi:unnamed protein product [Linum tenue]|uniref:F-box domain-containing protein n=1 Tax=Linum tenue TaxID=586396 RepID=A0AAV0NIY4_9ROSI|nr:unnamed protein product [Linum tenue]
MKRLCETNASRIGGLPAEVIRRLLTFLPVKEASRTSLLSREWRHRWRSIPQLVFDDSFAPAPEKGDCSPDDGKFLMHIYEALLLHEGPITKFELAIPGLGRCHPKLDLLMLYLSSKGVQELTLLFSGTGRCGRLHSALFSAIHLKRLTLQRCRFTPPSGFEGFPKLTHLQLANLWLPLNFFEHVLPKFPLLEELRVLPGCYGYKELAFVAPSLKVLSFHSTLWKLCFKHTPVLSVVSVLDPGLCNYAEDNFADDVPDMVRLFESLPALQHLNLGVELLLSLAAAPHVPCQLPTSLRNLKFLEIPRLLLDRLPQAQVLVCLIMSSPNLETLTIRIDDDSYHPPSGVIANLVELLEAEDHPGVCRLQHLKEFNIRDSRGTQVELDLVRFVLATAPLLHRISVLPLKELSSKKVVRFLKEVTLYKRISKEAELKYLWDDEVDNS